MKTVFFEKMSELISEKCALTETVVTAALRVLNKEMTMHLIDGKIVRIGTFDSFQLGISSTGVYTKAEASGFQVTSTRVKFR